MNIQIKINLNMDNAYFNEFDQPFKGAFEVLQKTLKTCLEERFETGVYPMIEGNGNRCGTLTIEEETPVSLLMDYYSMNDHQADGVDNEIFNLANSYAAKPLEWDIEKIGVVRDALEDWVNNY